MGRSHRADNDVGPSRSAALGLTAPGVELQPGSRGKPARVSNGRKYQYALPDHADEPPPTLVPPIRRLLRPQRRLGPGVSPCSKTFGFFAGEIVPASHGLSASGAASRGTVSCDATISTENQREASIEDQVRLCTARIAAEGWTVVGTYTDHALSGANHLRAGYQQLLADARVSAAPGSSSRCSTSAPSTRRCGSASRSGSARCGGIPGPMRGNRRSSGRGGAPAT